MLREILCQHLVVIISGTTYVIGLNCSILAWALRDKNYSRWMLLSTLCMLDVKFLQRLFIEGPGVIFVIVWGVIALIIATLIPSFLFDHLSC